MKKEKVIYKLEEARDLVTEARYIIEEIIPDYNILGIKNKEVLEQVTDIIKILSQLNLKASIEIPVEGMYKLLYHDYQKVCNEKKELQKDVVALMSDREFDKDTATLNLKLLRAEREIEGLKNCLVSQKDMVAKLKSEKRDLKRKLKELGQTTIE